MGSQSPLASKSHRFNNNVTDRQDAMALDTDTRNTAFNDCLWMLPTDSEVFSAGLPQKLSPELEPPSPSFLFAGVSGFTSPLFEQDRVETPALPRHYVTQLVLHMSKGMQASLAVLEIESHATHLAQVKKEQNDKSTGTTYQWHIKRYEQWWLQYQVEQMARILGWTSIPAFPITAAKVSMFLEYEATCEKVCSPYSIV
jgi:hypothetical protein